MFTSIEEVRKLHPCASGCFEAFGPCVLFPRGEWASTRGSASPYFFPQLSVSISTQRGTRSGIPIRIAPAGIRERKFGSPKGAATTGICGRASRMASDHPMWSWIARSVSDPDDQVFFANGKWLNTAICCAFLGGLGFFANRTIGPLACANLLLLASLGVLVVRARISSPNQSPTFSPWSYGMRLEHPAKPKLVVVSCLRVLAGFSYLAKPSFEPFLVVFAASLGLRLILDRDLAAVPAAAAGALVALLLMGAIVTPLLVYKKEHFGAATFGYPKYWMWMDDFETEAWPWQDKYPGRVQLEMLPVAEAPSARWYFQRHTAETRSPGLRQVLRRFFGGFSFQSANRPEFSYGRHKSSRNGGNH